MREIVLDTETTGLDLAAGHRIVEIGCVELINCIPTGRVWHAYVNPDRDIPQAASQVHGLTLEFLRDKPTFPALAQELLDFIEGAMLVMHNAEFDFRFLNAELERIPHPGLNWERVVDTLALARRRHPGAPCSLDALCKRYNVDLTARDKHGALLDSRLLASVYVELVGGHQAKLEFGIDGRSISGLQFGTQAAMARPEPLPPRLAPEELAAHQAFVATLGPKAIWLQYG